MTEDQARRCYEVVQREAPRAYAVIIALTVLGRTPEQIAAKVPSDAPEGAREMILGAAEHYQRRSQP
jgi:hypothetical protein